MHLFVPFVRIALHYTLRPVRLLRRAVGVPQRLAR